MKTKSIRMLTLSAMFMAIGLYLPFLTGQIPQIGNMLLPMHIPVLLCGIICGPYWGAGVGFIVPLLRFVMFGMPPMPTALTMAFELCAYALVIGIMYSKLPKNVISTYISLVVAMIVGRVVWGAATAIVMGVSGGAFTMELFMAGAVINAIPGIIVQLVLIPVVIIGLTKAKVINSEKAFAS